MYNQDYYFYGQWVQIQGHAPLPPMKLDPGNGEESIRFLSLKERRQICMEEALKNSHTKWLALTLKERKDQSEWKLRLNLGAEGDWSRCLKRARVDRYFFDDMSSCRVVVLYPCKPGDY